MCHVIIDHTQIISTKKNNTWIWHCLCFSFGLNFSHWFCFFATAHFIGVSGFGVGATTGDCFVFDCFNFIGVSGFGVGATTGDCFDVFDCFNFIGVSGFGVGATTGDCFDFVGVSSFRAGATTDVGEGVAYLDFLHVNNGSETSVPADRFR